MPLYEYKCNRCGSLFEVIQKFSDEPLSIHDQCGGPVVRQVSAPALQFKGSGWYITDYAKSGSPSKDGGKDAGKDGGNSDSSSPSAKGGDSSSSPTTTSTPPGPSSGAGASQ